MAKYRFGIDLRVTNGFRSEEHQDRLFVQGRTKAQIEAKKKQLGITRKIEANPDANKVTNSIGG